MMRGSTTALELTFEGTEYRKKAIALAKTGKGLPQDIRNHYDQAIQKLKEATECNEGNTNNADYLTAVYELAQTYVDKAHMILEMGLVLQERESDTFGSLMTKATALLSTLPEKDLTLEMHLLLGKIAFEKSEIVNEPIEQEKLLIQSIEHLNNSLHKQKNYEPSIKYLETVMEALDTCKKDRKKFGNAVYHMCGELWKQGGSVKSWKCRFFS